MAMWMLTRLSTLKQKRRLSKEGRLAWVVLFACLVAWIGNSFAQAQPPSPLPQVPPIPSNNLPPPLDTPELIKAPIEGPVKGQSTLPPWNSEQVETLKQPNQIFKPACPPGANGSAQCDQNVPAVACPSPKDLEDYNKYVKEIIDPKNPLTVFNGRTRLMLFKETPIRVQVGDEKIVDFGLINSKTISLLGKALGNTVLNIWFPDPKEKTGEIVISYLVKVMIDPDEKARYDLRYKKLTDEINCTFPNSRVCLKLVGDKLVVSGQALDVAEATQILRIARAAAPRVDDAKLPFNATVNFDSATTTKDRVRDLLDAAGPYVINLLIIPGEQQVMLKVTVAEINRSAARSIGLNFSITNHNGLPVFQQNTGNIAGGLTSLGLTQGINGATTVGNVGANGLNQMANNLPTILDNGQISLAINALHQLGYARTLSEPSITALDGRQGSFQAGGQFPVPINSTIGLQAATGVNFVPFGVQVQFTPYITDRDRVRLDLSAEVSTRDLATGTVISGSTVPGLSTRNFQTTVTMRSGETFAVAGLIQNNLGAQSSRVPFFGDLPLIGRAFGYDQLNAGEQELVILVTPVFSHPLTNDEMTALPGSDLFEPSDLEFYLWGRLESRRSYDYRSPVRTDIHRMLNYQKCQDIYIYGPSGHSGTSDMQPAGAK